MQWKDGWDGTLLPPLFSSLLFSSSLPPDPGLTTTDLRVLVVDTNFLRALSEADEGEATYPMRQLRRNCPRSFDVVVDRDRPRPRPPIPRSAANGSRPTFAPFLWECECEQRVPGLLESSFFVTLTDGGRRRRPFGSFPSPRLSLSFEEAKSSLSVLYVGVYVLF